MSKRLIILLLLLSTLFSQAEEENDVREYRIQRIVSAPVIDGICDEIIWQSIPVTTDFVQIRPYENAKPTFKTEVKFAYDNGALYVAVYCFDTSPDSILRQLGNRDNSLNADFVRVSIDPYDQQQDNTSFLVYASGVQRDWKHSDGSFNAVWESAVSINEDGWSTEMRIPYSAIRFPRSDEQQWTMQVERHIRRYREDDIWSPIDKDDSNYMNYWGKLKGFKDIEPPVRLSLTPFITGRIEFSPNDDGEKEFDWLLTGGADMKYGLNESFTLDMTLLPDFSQVRSDDIINNLSAFEQVFDEQREFFQEGIELFSKSNLFYSRRIGNHVQNARAVYEAVNEEDGDEITSNPEISRLLNAFKISGRTPKGLGIGLFNAIEGRSFAEITNNDGVTRTIKTDPFSNYNIFVLDKNFDNNRSIYTINTNVVRTDDFDNANVLSTGFSVNTRNNDFNFRGYANWSRVNQKLEDDNTKDGGAFRFDFDRISGAFRYGYGFELFTKDYDINDLGLNFTTNYFQNIVSADYNLTDPFGKFLELYSQFRFFMEHNLETGEVSNVRFRISANTTLKKSFISMWMGSNVDPYGRKDYYEPRIDGRVFRDVTHGNIFFGFSTDFRKRLAIEAETWHTISREYDGIYHFGFWAEPRFRVNDHFTLEYGFNAVKRKDDIGFADFNSEEDPIFGRRNIMNYTNTFTGNYIFKNNLSLGLRMRHYWSTVDYYDYFSLNAEGVLGETDYTDPEQQNDNNFNSFNIDLLFSWEFAPGSWLSLSYKNEIFHSDQDIEKNIFQNFGSIFDQVQTNIISIRLLYYLDYVNVRTWVQNGRDKREQKKHQYPEAMYRSFERQNWLGN